SLSPPGRETLKRIPVTTEWLLNSGNRPAAVKESLNNRSFDLYEIAQMTRYEPARCLGLEDMGHLKVGARANVSIYDLNGEMSANDMITSLSDCWCLIKDGVPVRKNGAFTGTKPLSSIRYREVEADINALKHSDLLLNPTLRLENLKVEKSNNLEL
ncbi:amidohydrolase family protein, partial [Thermodesulfobacteriota bacterium]